jgi:hypothetical protein
LNFQEFFKKIKPRISWFDDEGSWYCAGCGRNMDKPEMERHWPINCSLSKMKVLLKIRQAVIKSNSKLYQKYIKANEVKIDRTPNVKDEDNPILLEWYHNRLEVFNMLPMNMGEPSGAKVIETLPIPLRKLTTEDLIPKICKKKIIKTGDPIIDSIPMRDMPFRDLENNILSYEELDELEEQEKEERRNIS